MEPGEFIWTVVAGAAVLFVGFFAKKIFGQNKDTELKSPAVKTAQQQKSESTATSNLVSNISVSSDPSTVIHNNIFPTYRDSSQKSVDEVAKKDVDIPTLKQKTRVLFIDDETFKQISNLRKAGWNVTQLKDVIDLDCPEIAQANVIFVDYKNVGKKFSNDQGLGIVSALKRRYGGDKWIIFYSAHPLPLSVYNRGADDYLAKNSTLIEIERKIIEGAPHVAK